MAGRFLSVVDGPAIGTRVAFDDNLAIGRDEAGDGSLGSDPHLSRSHARLYANETGEIIVEDLGSTNGTAVNGRRIAGPLVLRPGDQITVGSTTLRVEPPPPAGAPGVGPATNTVSIPRPFAGPAGPTPGQGPVAPAGYPPTASAVPPARPSGALALAGTLIVGAALAVALGVYGKEHTPAGRPIFTLGFSGVLQLKAWLASIVLALVVVQVLSAMWMWGRLPGAGQAPGWVAPIHRWSGSVAFVVSLPVAFHCLWSLGFSTSTTRVLVHSIAGCAFYGAYASKMLGLRLRNLPRWTIPVLGATVFATFVAAWLTAALWFFTRNGLPLT